MNWNNLEKISQLTELDEASGETPALIYKHSDRCGICLAVKGELDEAIASAAGLPFEPYYLDILANRALSNTIEQKYGVKHQSPQVLLIANGRCVYSASHYEIGFEKLVSVMQEAK